jgi:ankyrin repeat protein
MVAVYNNNIPLLRQLLIIGADPKRPNSLYGSALYAAAQIKNSIAAILLLTKNAPINNQDRNSFTPLLLAVSKNHSSLSIFCLTNKICMSTWELSIMLYRYQLDLLRRYLDDIP